MIIDSDAHVIETDATWDFLAPSDQRFRPVMVARGEVCDGVPAPKRGWLIDGKVRGFALSVASAEELADRSQRAGRQMVTPPGASDLSDVAARIRHMDALGVDIQVCHSSLFIEQVSDRPEIEVAICRAWNRWMADASAQGKGRIRWSCALPLLSMTDALDELRWARDHGACGIFVRGIEGDRMLQDPYFYPLYEAASELNVAIAVHIGNANPAMVGMLSANYTASGFWKFRLASVGAFHALMTSEVPDVFPALRFGFLEAAAQWLPYALIDLRRRWQLEGKQAPENPLRDKRMYVACQTDDDVPYLLKYAGEHNLVAGTDYGHTDQSSELDALSLLEEQDGLSEAQWRRIVDDNARALYAL